eukprot:jgi/Tetstr1/462349/TSEL_007355.t1
MAMTGERLDTINYDPWWEHVDGPFPKWDGPVGCKVDGGGNHRGQGRVGKMVVWRAVHNRDEEAIKKAVEEGNDVNEVEGAGNTPMHAAAYEGWVEGAELLLSLGAKIDASNNAGDRPWHTAAYVNNKEFMHFLEEKGATKEHGKVIVQDHVPKVKDFFEKECWSHHPKPYADYYENLRAADKRTKEHYHKHPEMYP